MSKLYFIDEIEALDYLTDNGKPFPEFKNIKEYKDFLERHVPMNEVGNGRFYFTVNFNYNDNVEFIDRFTRVN